MMVLIVSATIRAAAAAICAAAAHNYWLNERMAIESLDPLYGQIKKCACGNRLGWLYRSICLFICHYGRECCDYA